MSGGYTDSIVQALIPPTNVLRYSFNKAQSVPILESWTTVTMGSYLKSFRPGSPCLDYIESQHEDSLIKAIRAYLKFRFGSSSCDDLKDHCGEQEMQPLRFLCPATCNCDLAHAGLHYRTTAFGCRPQCKTLRPCTDHLPDETWSEFWSEFPNMLAWDNSTISARDHAETLRLSHEIRLAGCPLLSGEILMPLANVPFCQGSETLGIPPMTSVCPVSCGCLAPGTASLPGCPATCESLRQSEQNRIEPESMETESR